MSKPGYKSTEFWLTFVALLIGALLSSGVVQESTSVHQMVVFVASALAAMGYTAGRTFVKHSTTKAKAIIAVNTDGPSGND